MNNQTLAKQLHEVADLQKIYAKKLRRAKDQAECNKLLADLNTKITMIGKKYETTNS